MFTPKRGPKEGRAHPGLPFTTLPNGKSRFNRRQIILIVLALCCIPIFFFLSNSASGGVPLDVKAQTDQILNQGSSDLKHDDVVNNVVKQQATENVVPKVATPRVPKDESPPPPSKAPAPAKPVEEAPKKAAKPTPAPAPVGDDDDEEPAKRPKPAKSDSTRKHKQSSSAEKWTERSNFEVALTKVVSLLPDEVIMRELTREVDSTGKERMREMGLRTRAYKKYFEAWEALHLAEDDQGSVYVRDDVVQYLRSHSHASASPTSDDSDDGGLAGMSLAQTIRAYESYRSFLLKFSQLLFPWTAPYFSDHMSLHAHFKKGGRGIVLTAGDDQAPYLLTTIVTFRKLGCNLPIEVMYLGDQDLGEDYRMELEALDGVITRDIALMTNDEGWKLAGWAAKPFAILLSSFREVIFIDADSLFFKNPEILFDDPGYQSTGALFFKDRLIMPESKKRWLQQVLPKPISKMAKQSRFWTGESGHMQESGVVVVDKWKHFIPLLLVTRFNGPDRDGNKDKGKIGVYDMVYGDKETFWIGFLLAGDEHYHFHEGAAAIMGLVKDQDDPTLKPRLVDYNPNPNKNKPSSKAPPPSEAQKAMNAEKDTPASSDGTPAPSDDDDSKTDKYFEDPDNETLQHLSPQNFTICAPQLLHLDTSGAPLWFNGWLLDNKFADKGKKRFATFESYVVEPSDIRDPGAWQLAESNMCCLTSDSNMKFDFNDADRKVLEMIMDRAKEIGAYGTQ